MRIYHQKKAGGVKTENFYTDIYYHARRIRWPLFKDRRLSQQFAFKLQQIAAAREAGIPFSRELNDWIQQLSGRTLTRLAGYGLIDPSRISAAKPLVDHLKDYAKYLEGKGDTPEYIKKTSSRISRISSKCRFKMLPDIRADKIQQWLSDELKAERISQQTHNHYIKAFRGLLNWLRKEQRLIGENSALTLHTRTITQRRRRRALNIDEISFLLDWLRNHGQEAYGLTGTERAHLYHLAVATGLRANEIRSLTVSSIDAVNKTVSVEAAYTKNKRAATLPINDELLNALARLTAHKLPTAPLFQNVPKMTAEMLRNDMAAARKTADGKPEDFLDPHGADFHALRHTFCTLLAAGGVHPKTAQVLMRHGSIQLSLDVYTHSYRDSEKAAINSLPSFNNQKKGKEGKAC